jgi:hypothetical protein
LVCDACGDYATEDFERFQEAVDYKKNNEWASKKQNSDWLDICPECQEVK